MKLRDALRTKDAATIGYIAAWKFLGLLPPRWVRAGFEFAASRVARRPGVTDQLQANLARVVGKQAVTPALIDAAMRSYARYWAEAFCLPRLAQGERLRARLDASVSGVEFLDASIAKGKGVVLTLPHSGNWDMAGVWLVHHAGTFTTVAERLRPEVLFQAFVEFRESLGFEVIAHSGGPAPFGQLQQRLRAGGIVCLLGERDLKGSGVPVTFFGEDTTFPAGPAKLALDTGAALHAVHLSFKDDGWSMNISPEIVATDVQSTAQKIARYFEQGISATPEDWHMLQPVWPADRKPRK